MIGRVQEQLELLRRYESGRSEFVAVYGRLGVGKTALVDETLQGKFTFRHEGLSPAEGEKQGALSAQLLHFYNSLLLHGMEACERPQNWLDAFLLLELYLQKIDDGSRQLVFLDELPWMDTPRSGFVTALEGFWNTWGCSRKNLMLVVCGSAGSWILDNLVNDHGRLYGRLTGEIKLTPFSLAECESYMQKNGIGFSRYDIVQSYMIFGGIPYYLDELDRRMSLAQNVDRMFFNRDCCLRYEYDRLFLSTFSNPESMKTIADLLYTRRSGYTRKEISAFPDIPTGGALTKCLRALEDSGIIEKYVPFGMGRRDTRYKLTDPFCLFWLRFAAGRQETGEDFWIHNQAKQDIASWRSIAFEDVCFRHAEQIKKALGISGVRSSQSAWILHGDDMTVHTDLMIERDDNVISACEIRFCGNIFTVDKKYYRELLARQETLRRMISPKKAVYQTLITAYWLKKNEYSGVFYQTLTMDDLFEK